MTANLSDDSASKASFRESAPSGSPPSTPASALSSSSASSPSPTPQHNIHNAGDAAKREARSAIRPDGRVADSRMEGSLAEARSSTSSPAPRMAEDARERVLDETLMDALRSSRDRLFLIRQETDMSDFVADDSRSEHTLPLMNSYQRLLVHRCADFFRLRREVDADTKVVTLTKTPETRIPSRKLVNLFNEANSTLKPADTSPFAVFRGADRESSMERIDGSYEAAPQAGPQSQAVAKTPISKLAPAGFRIMRRDPSLPKTSQTRPPSAQSSGTSSLITDSARKSRRDMTIEEREAAYREARERIFGQVSPDVSQTAGSTTAPPAAPSSVKPHPSSGNVRGSSDAEGLRSGHDMEDSPSEGPESSRKASENSEAHGHPHNRTSARAARPDQAAMDDPAHRQWARQMPSTPNQGPSITFHPGNGVPSWQAAQQPMLHHHHPYSSAPPQAVYVSGNQMTGSHGAYWPSQSQSHLPFYPQSFGLDQQTQQFHQAPSPVPWPGTVPTVMPPWNRPSTTYSAYNLDAFSPFPPTPSNLSSNGTGSVGVPSPAPSVVSSISSAAAHDGDERPSNVTWHAGDCSDSTSYQPSPYQLAGVHSTHGNHASAPVGQSVYSSTNGQLPVQQLAPLRFYSHTPEPTARSTPSVKDTSFASSQRAETSSSGAARGKRSSTPHTVNGSTGRLNVSERTLFDPNGPSTLSTTSAASAPAAYPRSQHSYDTVRPGAGASADRTADSAAGHSGTTQSRVMPGGSSRAAAEIRESVKHSLHTHAVHSPAPSSVVVAQPLVNGWPTPYPSRNHNQEGHGALAGRSMLPPSFAPNSRLQSQSCASPPPQVPGPMLGTTIRFGAVLPAANEAGASGAGSRANPVLASSLSPTPLVGSVSVSTAATSTPSHTLKVKTGSGLPPRPDWVLPSHAQLSVDSGLGEAETPLASTQDEHDADADGIKSLPHHPYDVSLAGSGAHLSTGISTPRGSHALQHAMVMTNAGQEPQTSPPTPLLVNVATDMPQLPRRRYSLDGSAGHDFETADGGGSSTRGSGLSVRRQDLRRRFSTDSTSMVSDDGSYSSLGPSASASNVGDFRDEEDDIDVAGMVAQTSNLEIHRDEVGQSSVEAGFGPLGVDGAGAMYRSRRN
ncbi:unnamed protein product [Parajaminaea phylloscopi]